MNSGLETNHISIRYYDGDYPSKEISTYHENCDGVLKYQGLEEDVERYKEIASKVNGNILEVCCGTGRVAIPLAKHGFEVTGVDISKEMLNQFKANLDRQSSEVKKRTKLVEQDITILDLKQKKYDLAICAFNSLLCITNFEDQCKALNSIMKHLKSNGTLVLDIVNPLELNLKGVNTAKAFFTRRNPHTGNYYTRFAMCGPIDKDHKQELYGWYDEVDKDGNVKRSHYSMHWRPIFRFEIELMLDKAGFDVINIEGGHNKEAYTSDSPRMFIEAKKR